MKAFFKAVKQGIVQGLSAQFGIDYCDACKSTLCDYCLGCHNPNCKEYVKGSTTLCSEVVEDA